jgi:hypothetical protein
LSRQDPPRQPDEPEVGRWPRAWRMIFLILAGVAGWVLVIVIAGYVKRRLGL